MLLSIAICTALAWMILYIDTVTPSPSVQLGMYSRISQIRQLLILSLLKICSTKVCKFQGKSVATAILVTSIVNEYV